MIKKFSEKFNEGKSKLKESKPDNVVLPDTDSDRPMNPNTSKETVKKEKPKDTSNMMPVKSEVDSKEEKVEEKKKIDFYGKVAKFPKQTKASRAYAHLESVKISKNSIWYMLIEKQDDQLQMVKYNYRKGVDLHKFVSELKEFYLSKIEDPKIKESVSMIEVDGNDKFSIIKNISKVKVDGKLLITKLTEDLIRLLSK